MGQVVLDLDATLLTASWRRKTPPERGKRPSVTTRCSGSSIKGADREEASGGIVKNAFGQVISVRIRRRPSVVEP